MPIIVLAHTRSYKATMYVENRYGNDDIFYKILVCLALWFGVFLAYHSFLLVLAQESACTNILALVCIGHEW